MGSQDNKKRILVCIDWYEPAFKAGGPIRSVVNIVNALKEDFEFYILTGAYDLGETEELKDIQINQWYDKEGVFVKYLSESSMNAANIKQNIVELEPDTIYLNSLFSRLFTLTPLMLAKKKNIPVVLAPRGMLGQGALAIKKGKKKTFLAAAKIAGLYKNILWHASTQEEVKEIKAVFGKKAEIHVAQNIPQSQKMKLDDILNQKRTGLIRFIFVSRIAVKKNLHLAIEAVKQLKTDREIIFDIYGNIEEQSYYDTFKSEIGVHDRVKINYKGVVEPGALPMIYADADLFVLPTKHENYGHAIVEAWANGCPVIISTNTPWKNLRVQNLGWDVDISDPQNLVKTMQEAVDLDFTSYISMVRASYNYFRDKISESEVIESNRKLFE